MKTKIASLLAMFLMTTFVQLSAMKRITVEAINNDISYYLDLKAVASVFGESRNLEDFERRLNDYDTQISNLDLNGDGEIDYLRVIETRENSVHLVVIQAILDRNVFQDVATIVVERDNNRQSYVQIVGDPYLYGYNYIVEPVYYRTPPIYSWFWSRRYRSWESPFYWGYYPNYYRYRRPIEINIYLSHVHHNINSRNYYRYSDNIRNERAYQSYRSVSRNDYGNRYPDRTFSNRNKEITNRASFDNRSRTNSSRNASQRTDYEQGRRINSVENSRNSNRQNSESRSEVNRTNNRISTPSRSNTETRSNESTNRNAEINRNSSTNRPNNERGAENNRVSTPSRNNPEPSRNERTNVNPEANSNSRSSSRPESTVQPRTNNERSEQPASRATRNESVKTNEGNSRSNNSSSRVSSESRGSERRSSTPTNERRSSSNNNSESRSSSRR